MRAAQPLLAKGLFGRTFEELKRRTTIGMSCTTEKPMFTVTLTAFQPPN